MTVEHFKQKVRKKNLNKIIIEFLIVIVILGVGVLLACKLYFTDWFERGKPNAGELTKTIPYLFSIGIIFFGFYGVYRILNCYKVITIRTDLGKEKNLDLVHKIAGIINWTFISNELWTEYFANTNIFFGYSYTILVFADNEALHFDIQTISSGLFDFGDRSRLIKKLERVIVASLEQKL